MAQGWADKCVSGHNLGKVGGPSSFSWIGENIASMSSGTDFARMVDWWDDEKKVYNHGTNKCTPSPTDPMLHTCGHYTQVNNKRFVHVFV